MNTNRLKILQADLKKPLLVKKKENLLYLTGRSFLSGWLLVKKNDIVFFGDGLEKIEGIKKADRFKYIGKYIQKGRTLFLEDVFTFAEAEYLKSKLPGFRYQVTRSPVDEIRAIKESQEMRQIESAMKITGRVFQEVKKQLHGKVWTEKALAEFIKKTGLRMGAEDVSFEPIVASGANAAVPHHKPSNKKLSQGESIILDFGFKYRGYCSDFTRTVFLKKVSSKKIEEAYRQTEAAYLDTLLTAKPGIKTARLYENAVKILEQKKLAKYFIHSLGHGTGLEIHELPNLSPQSRESLQNGHVFSIEPGVYIPKLGGIRIEDLVYLPPHRYTGSRGEENNRLKKFIFASTRLEDNII